MNTSNTKGKTIVPLKTYTYTGRLNQTEFPAFIKICKMSQEELKFYLTEALLSIGYKDVVTGDGYVYAKGEIPVLLTAHMDTVHEHKVVDFYEDLDTKGNHVLASPQGIGGDDRCGIYMILQIITNNYRPSILFCEDEEIGGVGSDKVCQTDIITELSELKYMIELDRANSNDAVFYDCENFEFSDYITSVTGYKESWGSFSDISFLAPSAGIAAVNLSCGYYNAHTLGEKVCVEEMLNTIEKVELLLNDIENCSQFEYIARRKSFYDNYYGDYSRYSDWYGYDYDDDEYGYYRSKKSKKKKNYKVETEISYIQKEGKMETIIYNGISEEACLCVFFQEHPAVCFSDILDYSSIEI